MGMTATAHLVYGYDLGSSEEFRAEQRGEYGGPDLPWFDEDEHDGFAGEAEKVLLASAGFTEARAESDGYWERERAAKAQVGVEFASTGHVDLPGWVLHATGSERAVAWSETMVLDPAELAQARPEWDVKLAAALTALGITPTQVVPRWLIFPSYG